MKTKIIATLIASILPLSALAQSTGVGGGDQCKNEINNHRLAIKGWIERDEAKDLDFKNAKIMGLNYQTYKRRMLSALTEGKVVVTCYLDPARISDPAAQAIAREEGISYRSVMVSDSRFSNPAGPSACINYEDSRGVSHIDCNYDSIMNENSLGNPNYINTHHEFASIARVEARRSAPSDFSISNQLAQYEQTVSMKVLGPKMGASRGAINIAFAEVYAGDCDSRRTRCTFIIRYKGFCDSPNCKVQLKLRGATGYSAKEIYFENENKDRVHYLDLEPVQFKGDVSVYYTQKITAVSEETMGLLHLKMKANVVDSIYYSMTNAIVWFSSPETLNLPKDTPLMLPTAAGSSRF